MPVGMLPCCAGLLRWEPTLNCITLVSHESTGGSSFAFSNILKKKGKGKGKGKEKGKKGKRKEYTLNVKRGDEWNTIEMMSSDVGLVCCSPLAVPSTAVPSTAVPYCCFLYPLYPLLFPTHCCHSHICSFLYSCIPSLSLSPLSLLPTI
jgi:hypothetical protein